MTEQNRCDDTLREELGTRAFAAMGSENASPWNTEWAIEGRCMKAAR